MVSWSFGHLAVRFFLMLQMLIKAKKILFQDLVQETADSKGKQQFLMIVICYDRAKANLSWSRQNQIKSNQIIFVSYPDFKWKLFDLIWFCLLHGRLHFDGLWPWSSCKALCDWGFKPMLTAYKGSALPNEFPMLCE
jgi:hypothetical protein